MPDERTPDERTPDEQTPDDGTPAPDTADPAAAAAAALRRATASTSKSRTRSKAPRRGGSRDPELLGSALDRLVEEQGWQDRSAVAVLMGEWPQIVGDDLAAHVQPVSYDDAQLVLQAESTTWATQVRLLLPRLQEAIDARLGAGVVRTIRIQGPQAPSWAAGPRRVKGRGPRDTYG